VFKIKKIHLQSETLVVYYGTVLPLIKQRSGLASLQQDVKTTHQKYTVDYTGAKVDKHNSSRNEKKVSLY